MATILIVDDRPVNRQYLVTLLGYCGHRTLEAADGAEALALARTESTDLIITDIIMPTMDGAEMVQAIRADPTLAATPVIFYSASYREKETRVVAAGCGVSIVLSKPADPEIVIEAVNKALGSRTANAEAPAGVKPPGPDLGLVTDALGQRLVDQQRSASRLAVIIELGLDLTSEPDPARLIQKFCRGARDIVTARFASVGLLNEDGRTLDHFHEDGMSSEDEALSVPLPLRGELGQLVADGKARRLSGTLKWSDLGLTNEHLTPSSFLGVAVATARRTYGWLCFCNKVGAAEFTDEDERLAITLVAQMAVAYENVLLQAAAHRDAEALRLQASTLAAAANAIFITDSHGTILWVNPAFTALNGYTAEEAVGQNPRVLKSGRQDQAFYRDLWQTILGGQSWRGEFINRRKDGSLYTGEETITPVRVHEGPITHFIGIMSDVTVRKQAEIRIRHLNRVYAVLSDINQTIVRLREPQRILEAACRIAVEQGGFRMAWIGFVDATRKSVEPVAHAGVARDYLEKLKIVLGDDPRGHGPIAVALHDGTHVVCNDIEHDPRMIPWREDARRLGYRALAVLPLTVGGESVGTFNLYVSEPGFFDDEEMRLLGELALDIGFALEVSRRETERKRAEVERTKLARDIELLLASTGEGIYGLDLEGRCTLINRAATAMFGCKPGEWIGQNIHDLVHHHKLDGSSYPVEECPIIRASRKGESIRVNTEVFWRQDGTSFPVEYASFPILDEGKVTGAVVSFSDITERRQAEQHLRDSTVLYHSLVENLPQHVFRKDRAGRFTFGNGLFCQSLGKLPAEILGKTDLDFFPAPLAAKYRQDDQHVLQTGQSFEGDEEHRPATGKTIVVHVVKIPLRAAAGQIIGVQGIAWDITEKKQMEAQKLRTQRLESIGTLAGGVAHDLNNTLAPILMATQLLRMQYPDETKMIDTVESSARRGAEMVRQLLTFARGVEGARLLVQSRHLLKAMQKIIKATFPKNIELKFEAPRELRTILGDATQLHQVLLNLCVNARDAMPNGGTLTLEAENTEIDATYASAAPEAKPGSYVVWRVKDTGTGIPPEIIERIFEPFFSTKGPDKGTGLGLSTVIGIVKSHGGFIVVDSKPDHGTTFTVYLPAESGDATPEAPVKTEGGFRGHGETILVVDDEDLVRQVTRAVLTALNFKVLTAPDGVAALLTVAACGAELRAVITDLHMPNLDGLNFVRVLKHMLPQAGVIVASGRLDEREASEFKTLGVSAMLDKPFRQEKLIEALKTVFQN